MEAAQRLQPVNRVSLVLNLVFIVLFPGLGAIAAIAMAVQGRVTGFHIGLFAVFFVLTGLGITVGYHRLLTHRSFETHAAVKVALLAFGSMAVEGPVIGWSANHLKHHAFSDRPGDPHSPNQGFFHAHWGWLVRFSDIDERKFASHLIHDPVVLFMNRTFIFWVTAGYVIPFLIGSWEGLIWGGLFRQLAVQNVTFAINSVCHRWGTRPFKTGDRSTNNWVFGVLGLGEGWHNNHHAFPSSAFHGLRWWEIDLSAYVIRGLAAVRLAWNVRHPDRAQIQAGLAIGGGGS